MSGKDVQIGRGGYGSVTRRRAGSEDVKYGRLVVGGFRDGAMVLPFLCEVRVANGTRLAVSRIDVTPADAAVVAQASYCVSGLLMPDGFAAPLPGWPAPCHQISQPSRLRDASKPKICKPHACHIHPDMAYCMKKAAFIRHDEVLQSCLRGHFA